MGNSLIDLSQITIEEGSTIGFEIGIEIRKAKTILNIVDSSYFHSQYIENTPFFAPQEHFRGISFTTRYDILLVFKNLKHY